MGSFVGVVVIALVWANITPAGPQGTTLSFQELALFGGPASTHSLNESCKGDSQLEVYISNSSPSAVSIQSVAISGSGVENATAFVTVSNACLTISEASPVIPAGGDYQLVGYVSAPLVYTRPYNCTIIFSNGQSITNMLLAQS